MDIEYNIKYDKNKKKWIAEEKHIIENISYYGIGQSPRQAFEEIQSKHLDYLTNYLEKKSKICEIINQKFCILLKVDGKEIALQCWIDADYFKQHYESLGYIVKVISDLKK